MNPADLTLSISPTLTTRALAQPSSALAAAGFKNGRAPIPRVDLEPIYTQLKAALGDQWGDYKLAVNQFVLGHLNQAELSWVLQPLLSSTTSAIPISNAGLPPVSILHLHNALVTAIYANTLRDPPPSDVAPWVVATDKPTSASKNAGASGANDKAEERLRKEVMSMHARDRKRIKALKETGKAVNDGFADIQAYKHELAVKPPDVGVPPSGAGITKTNWDLEIRRRYAQSLAEETLEFPTTSDLQNRIEPICYEEGVVGGVNSGALQACAELMEQATEVYLKELLGALCAHSRANSAGCIQTHSYRRQLRREETEAERGMIQRNPSGLLPIELETQAKRAPLNLDDLQLALQLHDPFLRQDRFLMESIALNRHPEILPPPKANGLPSGGHSATLTNGALAKHERARLLNAGTAMELDETMPVAEGSWIGSGRSDAHDLMGALDECLAVG